MFCNDTNNHTNSNTLNNSNNPSNPNNSRTGRVKADSQAMFIFAAHFSDNVCSITPQQQAARACSLIGKLALFNAVWKPDSHYYENSDIHYENPKSFCENP